MGYHQFHFALPSLFQLQHLGINPRWTKPGTASVFSFRIEVNTLSQHPCYQRANAGGPIQERDLVLQAYSAHCGPPNCQCHHETLLHGGPWLDSADLTMNWPGWPIAFPWPGWSPLTDVKSFRRFFQRINDQCFFLMVDPLKSSKSRPWLGIESPVTHFLTIGDHWITIIYWNEPRGWGIRLRWSTLVLASIPSLASFVQSLSHTWKCSSSFKSTYFWIIRYRLIWVWINTY